MDHLHKGTEPLLVEWGQENRIQFMLIQYKIFIFFLPTLCLQSMHVWMCSWQKKFNFFSSFKRFQLEKKIIFTWGQEKYEIKWKYPLMMKYWSRIFFHSYDMEYWELCECGCAVATVLGEILLAHEGKCDFNLFL